tara:strand:- start:8772 stop:9293 length:522 start_codon:yes stop_codon:yes gene_type:complete
MPLNKEAEETTIVSSLKVRWKGILDWPEFYKKTKSQLKEMGYGDERKNFVESKYVERLKGESKNVEIAWKGEKSVDDYITRVIEVTFLIIGLKDVEFENNGTKTKMNSADIEIKFNAKLITNKKGAYKKTSLMKKVYENFLIADLIERNKIDIYKDIYKVHDEVKNRLNLTNY